MAEFTSVDQVFDFAIAREIDAYNLYVRLADCVERPDVHKVLKDFATDEVEHRIRLEAVKAGEVAIEDEEVGSLNIAESVKDVEPDAKMSYADLLVVGMKKEQRAFDLYTNLAAVAHDQEQRDTFRKLAQEEAKHKLRLEIEYDWVTS